MIFRHGDPPLIARWPGKRPGCRWCGSPTPLVEHPRSWCSDECRAAVVALPVDQRPPETSGTCRNCGKAVPPVTTQATYCSDEHRRWFSQRPRASAFRDFEAHVERPRDLTWLAKRLKLDPGDPRVPEVARILAEEDKLHAYVTREGVIGDVGMPVAAPSEGARGVRVTA